MGNGRVVKLELFSGRTMNDFIIVLLYFELGGVWGYNHFLYDLQLNFVLPWSAHPIHSYIISYTRHTYSHTHTHTHTHTPHTHTFLTHTYTHTHIHTQHPLQNIPWEIPFPFIRRGQFVKTCWINLFSVEGNVLCVCVLNKLVPTNV